MSGFGKFPFIAIDGYYSKIKKIHDLIWNIGVGKRKLYFPF